MRYQLEPDSMRKAYAEFDRIRSAQCPSTDQVAGLTNLIAWSSGIMYGAGVQESLRRKAAELHIQLREYLAEVTCASAARNPGARQANPKIRWKLSPDQSPTELQTDRYYEIYDSDVTRAALGLSDSWSGMSKAEVRDLVKSGDARWTVRVYDRWNGRWYQFEDFDEDPQYFSTREEALEAASIIAADIADARVRRGPRWRGDDLVEYLEWFQAQIPNRVDYVRLLWANDANGAYDILLTSPVREAEESFHQAFDEIIEEGRA